MTKKIFKLAPTQVCECVATVHNEYMVIHWVGPRITDNAIISIPRDKAIELANAILEEMA